MSCVPDQLSQKKSGLIIDSFAGGGGASTGIELALGRSPDVAINHDPIALAIHRANHPHTKHYCQDITQLHPRDVAQGRPVDLLWASPDCKHFSKAKGGKPRSESIRDLPWTVVLWAETVRPRLIILENVEEFRDWGPLDADNMPIKSRKGETFQKWIGRLRSCGYTVDHRDMRACDYGAPTIRKRLFVIARCDGLPIVWPEPTHGPGRLPYRTAAEIIDWTLPCPSIFERAKPLAENTCKRIAKGIVRFVLNNPRPFIIGIDNKSNGAGSSWDSRNPLTTITTENRHAVVSPVLAGCGGRAGQSPPRPCDKPLGTITAKADQILVTAHLARHFGNSVGSDCDRPVPTITAGGMGKTALVSAFLAKHYGGAVGSDLLKPIGSVTGIDHHSLVSGFITKFKGTCEDGQSLEEPLHTVQAEGLHHGAVAAFLVKYYGSNVGQECFEPLQTITTKHRFGLVTVTIQGEPYVLADIGMRMLQPRELFAAQGFPDSYIIDPIHNGKPLAKSAQVRACGNSVCPPLAAALVRANYVETDAGESDFAADRTRRAQR
jgi:DNA (cytosine-5)-methyltransferase 1